jgi:hypothetical protein
MRRFPTHSLKSFLLMGMTTRASLEGNGEPLRNEDCRVSQRESLDLGDELQRAASAVAISEAAPHALRLIDHELGGVAAFMNGTAPAQRRPDALELGVETIVRENERQGNEMPKPLEVDPLDCTRLRPVSKERSRHGASSKRMTGKRIVKCAGCASAWMVAVALMRAVKGTPRFARGALGAPLTARCDGSGTVTKSRTGARSMPGSISGEP